jgi:hypothetical protein
MVFMTIGCTDSFPVLPLRKPAPMTATGGSCRDDTTPTPSQEGVGSAINFIESRGLRVLDWTRRNGQQASGSRRRRRIDRIGTRHLSRFVVPAGHRRGPVLHESGPGTRAFLFLRLTTCHRRAILSVDEASMPLPTFFQARQRQCPRGIPRVRRMTLPRNILSLAHRPAPPPRSNVLVKRGARTHDFLRSCNRSAIQGRTAAAL